MNFPFIVPNGEKRKTTSLQLTVSFQLEVSLANSAIRKSLVAQQQAPYGQYVPQGLYVARQERLSPIDLGRLQLIYDA
jgi:hypothetical protein